MAIENVQDVKLITFDCYGTLIDWEQGLRNSLLKIDGVVKADIDDLVAAYIRTEASLEQQSYQSYAQIQRQTLAKLAERYCFELPAEKADTLSEDIGNWPPFQDTVTALKRLKSRYALGILSNIDTALFARTNKKLEVDFDLIVTAQDVRSYKPSHAHFLRATEQTQHPRESILHVAQSLYHDAEPAGALGFPFIWITRYNHHRPENVQMVAQFPDMASFANMLLA